MNGKKELSISMFNFQLIGMEYPFDPALLKWYNHGI